MLRLAVLSTLFLQDRLGAKIAKKRPIKIP